MHIQQWTVYIYFFYNDIYIKCSRDQMLIYHFFHTLTCHERGGDVLPGAA